MGRGLCSNRTFMELKYGTATIIARTSASSNRTFMELKLIIRFKLLMYLVGSNRTFMELKSRLKIDNTPNEDVLIVPLWN